MAVPGTRNPCSQYDQSVIQALEAKYLEVDDEEYTEGIQIMHNLTALKGSGKVMLPQCLALNYCHISKAGDAGRLHELCQQVKELDIAENDLKDWNEVLNIVKEIPHLRFLNLSSNPLGCKMSTPASAATHIATLRGLALNNTKVPWHTVYQLLQIMPGLEELHLSLNDYRKIPSPDNKKYPQLTLLQFNENQISVWEELIPLGKAFPQLTSLILIGNKLRGKITPEVSATFPKLSCLNLTNTCMQSWEELESLNNFASLVDVRLQGIPLCEDIPEEERRQLCIARLGNVSRLNGSPVLDLHREDAERAFIRHYMDTPNKPARYEELVKKHGHLNPLAEVDLQPNNTVKCTIHFEDRSEVILISLKQTIKEFKKSLSSVTSLPPSKFRVFYGPGDVDHSQYRWEELPPSSRMLHSHCVSDGDEFLIVGK